MSHKSVEIKTKFEDGYKVIYRVKKNRLERVAKYPLHLEADRGIDGVVLQGDGGTVLQFRKAS